MALLEVEHLTKRFGGLVAVSDFNLSLEEGELVGLIGPNGAGKTTIFNMITGIYRPTEGVIRFGPENLVGKEPHVIANLGIARTFQNLRIFKDMTVLQNVLIGAQMETSYSIFDAVFRTPKFRSQENRSRERAESLLDITGLADYASMKASSLPYGYQRRLEIARALALQPKILLLDEPAAGMNPEETLELMDFIKSIHKTFGLAILLIEHHMDVVMGLCDRIIVLNFGQILAKGSPTEIQSNPSVIAAYLGEEDESAQC